MQRCLRRVRAAVIIRSNARRLAEDRRGSPAIEFCFVAGPLLALIIAVIQTTLAFFAQQNIDSVAEITTRQLMTGSVQQSTVQAKKTVAQAQADFNANVCAKLPSFMQCSNVLVDVRTTSSFAGVDTGTPKITFDRTGKAKIAFGSDDPGDFQFTPGGPGQITIARVMYIWDVQKGPLGFDLSTLSSGQRLLVSTSVFKTEPYQ